MADQKISAMPAASTLDGTEITPIVQSGVNKQITTAEYVSEVLDVNPVLTTQGGTNITSYTLGDTLYASATNVLSKLAGNTTTTKKFLRQTGTGSASAAPVWEALSASSINAGYGQFIQDGQTALTAGISNNSTTPIQVTSTANFIAPGYIIIEQEVIAYTGVTATTFTGITRGVKGTTNTSHDPGVAVTEAAAVASATSSQTIGFDTTVYSNKVTIVSDDEITFAESGVFNIQFSLQFLNFTTALDDVVVWFRLNGSDVPESASVQQVGTKHGSRPGAIILALNIMQSVSAGDNVQLYWNSASGNTVLGTFPAGTTPVYPTAPAAILTVTQVA